ncbi:MAG: hypothetical protein ACW987_06465 [Candidatus Thorarchaeota archaeon]
MEQNLAYENLLFLNTRKEREPMKEFFIALMIVAAIIAFFVGFVFVIDRACDNREIGNYHYQEIEEMSKDPRVSVKVNTYLEDGKITVGEYRNVVSYINKLEKDQTIKNLRKLGQENFEKEMEEVEIR